MSAQVQPFLSQREAARFASTVMYGEGGAAGLVGGGWGRAVKITGHGLGAAFAGALLLRGGAGVAA